MMMRLEKTLDLDVPQAECFHVWATIEGYPRFMSQVRAVTQTEVENIYRWDLIGPDGQLIPLEVEIKILVPNESLLWHSLAHSSLEISGRVRLEALDVHRTRVHLNLAFDQKTRSVAASLEPMFKNPEAWLETDLEQFRLLMLKQPAGLKSQSGLSESGTLQGQAEPLPEIVAKTLAVNACEYPQTQLNLETGEIQHNTHTQVCPPQFDRTERLIPMEAPGDVPDIGEEYTTIGVSGDSPDDERKVLRKEREAS